jgi:iron complex transport system substrate-binding protein
MNHPFRNIAILICVILFSCSCKQEKKHVLTGEEDARSGTERLLIEKKLGYSSVTVINPWQGATDVNLKWNLVKRGDPIPAGLDSSSVIFVPVRNIICMSTTHVAMITALGEEESITGVSGTDFIYSEILNKKIREGKIKDVGYETSLNRELILKISPDLVMMYGIGSESAGYMSKISELGIKVIFNADYLETDPLKKAEWIRLFGALYCKEHMADSILHSVSEDYEKIKNTVNQQITTRPSVLLGLPYKDTWFISPGNSFMSRLISDAGGDYLWSNTISEISMPYGIENVYVKAVNADYWLNTGSASSLDDITAMDERLSELKCFRDGKVFNNNNRVNEHGGNDYWETGSVYPNIIIKDIAKILHPDLFPAYNLIFYKKLEKAE